MFGRLRRLGCTVQLRPRMLAVAHELLGSDDELGSGGDLGSELSEDPSSDDG